jgi:hypothetical protein
VLVFGLIGFAAVRLVAGRLTRISRRRINPGLLGATIAVIGLIGWSLFAFGSAGIESGSAGDDFSAISSAQKEVSQLSLAETYVALQQIDRGEDQGADATAAKPALAATYADSDEAASSSAAAVTAARSEYGMFDACAVKAISAANDGQYESTVNSSGGVGGCQTYATALHDDLLTINNESQTHFDRDMSSLGAQYAGSGALPVGVAIGVLGALAAAYGLNRRLAEYR